jgi:hypothetical protein
MYFKAARRFDLMTNPRAYEIVKCCRCGQTIRRKRGVKNPTCVECHQKMKRESWRKANAVHMDTPGGISTLKATTSVGHA